MAPNFFIRPLGPLVSAVRDLQNSLYRPPRTTISSISDGAYPNPLQPVTPIGPPGAEPLRFPFTWGRNLDYTQRGDAEYSAEQLRQLARYIIASVCIENNKDILTRIPWKIQLRPLAGETTTQRLNRGKNDDTLKKLSDFFSRPNPQQDWAEFLRPILDDMLVIDSAAIFIGRNRSGKVERLEWMEGSSITRLIDEHGWTPAPPNVAYQQTYQGYPRLDLSTQQLVYRPRNIAPRNTQASYFYGFSPVEQVAKEIEVGIQRLQFILNFYTEGSVPGGMIFAPLDTPPDKIKEAQQFLDSDLAGNLAKKRRIQILQGFQRDGKSEQVVFPKEPALSDIFDELHIRKICFAFGTSPTRLMRSMNRSSGEQAQNAAEEEGTLPWLAWLKGTVDHIIQVQMGFTEYEWSPNPFMELDRLKQAMADGEDIKVGLYSRNEKRINRGDDPSADPAADKLFIQSPSGDIPIGDYMRTGPTGGSTGARPPATGAQPKASRQAVATQGATSSTAGKANGSARWAGCSVHKDSYPRVACAGCVRSEIDYQQKLYHENQQEEAY